MNLLLDRNSAHANSESRRLWDDQRVWVVNCLAVEAGWLAMPQQERAEARRGCDRMLAVLLEAW